MNVIVVVNQNSANSVALGNDYCELRGVPPQNVFRLTGWTGGDTNWTPDQFTSFLANPLVNLVTTRGLTNQVEIVLLSMDIPYRVTDGYNEDSTTSALFYGFKTNTGPTGSCSLPDVSSNSYAYSELPFSLARPNTAATNAFLTMMLTDTNLAAAESTLHRAVATDHSRPTQLVYLEKTDDAARNVRYAEADNAVFENLVVSNSAVSRITSDNTSFTNLLGFQTGLPAFQLATNGFVAGAPADNLTSWGGYIFDSYGQTLALDFLEAGATASYGTVVEPCQYLQKFPDPLDYFYELRGFSLVEAYYQSVLNPFEGLMVGEPLCAPFARPGAGVWTSPTNGAVLHGPATLSLTFASATTNLPLAQADLFVDGTFYQTMTNVPPTPGNLLSATVNGYLATYTVLTNDTLARAAGGLAHAINLQSNKTQVVAFPLGDRIKLESHAIYVTGTNVTLLASAKPGTATNATTFLLAARPVFLNSVALGLHQEGVANAPLLGDWIRLTIQKTNGVSVTLGVTNRTLGGTIGALVQNLYNLVNANATLGTADGVLADDFLDYEPAPTTFNLYARTPGAPAAQIKATLTTSSRLTQNQPGTYTLTDNLGDIVPRNHLYVASGTNLLAVNFTLDTTRLADGWHQLTAVAYEGTSVRTQTRVVENVLVQNTSLAATLASSPAGSNAALTQPLQFTLTPNTPNVASIILFSTGGSIAVVSNQPATTFSVVATNLGLGLHPFYALVTDTSGHQYRSQTVWYRIFPAITLTLAGQPAVLSWPATPGSQYAVQSATNLLTGFQTMATLTATNSLAQWPVTHQAGTQFYRVQLLP